MAKPKVYATHQLFDEARQILDADCDVEYWAREERPSREEVLRRVKDKEGLVCLLTEKVNDEFLRLALKLRIAANVAVGYDNIDVDACTKRGVVATNTPGTLVSRWYGGRSSSQPAGGRPSSVRSGPVLMKPCGSRMTVPSSQSVNGAAPMKTNIHWASTSLHSVRC